MKCVSLLFLILFTFFNSIDVSFAQGELLDSTDTPSLIDDTVSPPLIDSTDTPAGDPARGNNCGANGTVGICNPLGENTTLTSFFLQLIEIILIFAIPLIVFFIIYAGFKMVMAQGNEEELKTAKRAFIYAIIGGLLILGARLILEVIKGTVDAFTV